MAKAINNASFSYLKYVVQPYGTLISIIEFAGESSKIKLGPIEFEAGSDRLNGDSGEYLKVVSKLLKERPELELSICGKVTGDDINVLTEKAVRAIQEEAERSQSAKQDKEAENEKEKITVEFSDEELLGFARARALNIKKLLTEEHGIDPGRLFICNPVIDRTEDARPAVELLI
jgi:hypothetical protein